MSSLSSKITFETYDTQQPVLPQSPNQSQQIQSQQQHAALIEKQKRLARKEKKAAALEQVRQKAIAIALKKDDLNPPIKIDQ